MKIFSYFAFGTHRDSTWNFATDLGEPKIEVSFLMPTTFDSLPEKKTHMGKLSRPQEKKKKIEKYILLHFYFSCFRSWPFKFDWTHLSPKLTATMKKEGKKSRTDEWWDRWKTWEAKIILLRSNFQQHVIFTLWQNTFLEFLTNSQCVRRRTEKRKQESFFPAKRATFRIRRDVRRKRFLLPANNETFLVYRIVLRLIGQRSAEQEEAFSLKIFFDKVFIWYCPEKVKFYERGKVINKGENQSKAWDFSSGIPKALSPSSSEWTFSRVLNWVSTDRSTFC